MTRKHKYYLKKKKNRDITNYNKYRALENNLDKIDPYTGLCSKIEAILGETYRRERKCWAFGWYPFNMCVWKIHA